MSTLRWPLPPLSKRRTFAVLKTAPQPVATPQPSSATCDIRGRGARVVTRGTRALQPRPGLAPDAGHVPVLPLHLPGATTKDQTQACTIRHEYICMPETHSLAPLPTPQTTHLVERRVLADLGHALLVHHRVLAEGASAHEVVDGLRDGTEHTHRERARWLELGSRRAPP